MAERNMAGPGGAALVFRCTRESDKGLDPFLEGNLRVRPTDANVKLGDRERGEAAMAILHSVSLAMAKHLGCLEESGIPAKLPPPASPTA
ncbi:hypothetical protein ACZ90_01615 [Streptomyces albus subsp. albus]|nr:hypothetical protein ACZ90_01615 [Streptomyces albus subsp. albus]